jgi:hypothetical protein
MDFEESACAPVSSRLYFFLKIYTTGLSRSQLFW